MTDPGPRTPHTPEKDVPEHSQHGTNGTTVPERLSSHRKVPEFAALLAFLIVLGGYFSFAAPQFLSFTNVANILDQAAGIGIIAAPLTMLMIAGHIDLSVGSGLSLCAIVMAVVTIDHGPLVGVVATVLVGIAIGLINGFFVTIVGINSIITTLAMLAVLVGTAALIADGQTVGIPGFMALGTSRPIGDIPTPVLIFVFVSLLFWFLTRYTVFGRSMYATGANPAAARLVGIRSRKNIVLGFVLIGICVAVAALINVSQVGAASHTDGTALELEVVTAVVLGGTSIAGGRGSVPGTVLGVLIIGVLNNGLTLLNVDPFWQNVARGVLLLFATSFDQLRLRLQKESV